MFVTVFLDIGRARCPLAGAARPDRAAPVPARPRLHVHRLPRQQRLAGAAWRAGPQPRPWREEGVSRSTVLGTVVVERVVDTVMVVAIASLAVVVLSARGVMSSAVLLGLAFVTLLIIGLGLGIAAHRLPGADRVAAKVARWPRLLELGRRLRDGLAVAAATHDGGRARLQRRGLDCLDNDVPRGRAGHRHRADRRPGALLTSGVALVTIMPSGPGYLGTFELTSSGSPRASGSRDDAFALGLLVHLVSLLSRRSAASWPSLPSGDAAGQLGGRASLGGPREDRELGATPALIPDAEVVP